MAQFTAKEERVLGNFFTNSNSNIFCLVNMPEVVKGALFSRYSRSGKSVRRLFLDEFHDNMAKAEDFYERILVGYGDDSVAELGGVHIALEGVSNIVIKIIEDARIGISPLEKSTRYVFFDKKEQDRYLFYREPVIMKSTYGKDYERVANDLFDAYSLLVRTLFEELFHKAKPEGIDPVAYKASCRAKACDIARYLLPMGTYANVGLYGNGRAFEYLLIKLKASPFVEAHQVADKMTEELRKVIPAFVKRSHNERGKEYQHYITKTAEAVARMVGKHTSVKAMVGKAYNEVKLMYTSPDPVEQVIAGLMYPHSTLSHGELLEKAHQMTEAQKKQFLSEAVQFRKHRTHKVPRGFEYAQFTFEILSDIGAYRDLQRHRILTQQRQTYSTRLGFIIPQELEGYPMLMQSYVTAMEKAGALFEKLYTHYPHEAQYIVPFGYRIRYDFHFNLREAIHLTELRSSRQGHPSYRHIAQELARRIGKAVPLFAHLFQFVDNKSYELERLQAFQRVAAKAKKSGVKAFED